MRKFAYIVLSMMVVCSCNVISSIIHDDEVVAKLGSHKLYRTDVEKYIPDYVSPEDSAGMAQQYIRSWASGLLYMEVASEQLSKKEMDVTSELESYRNALLRYRYEQRYVSERLDTVVTKDQEEEYYEANKNDFVLERPIFKVRFVDVMKDSPYRDRILKYVSSDDYVLTDTLARSSALRFIDSSEEWIDAMVLAKEFGTDWHTMMGCMDGKTITMAPEGRGDMMVAYVCDIQRSGIAPLDYCKSSIDEMIISSRKHRLLENLEQELLEDALAKKKLVINQE